MLVRYILDSGWSPTFNRLFLGPLRRQLDRTRQAQPSARAAQVEQDLETCIIEYDERMQREYRIRCLCFLQNSSR